MWGCGEVGEGFFVVLGVLLVLFRWFGFVFF